jgi:predicted nucleic acid-binding protein
VIIADTSVWIDHFRAGNPRLRSLLEAGEIACHPFIVGEVACGRLRNRSEILSLLAALPGGVVAQHAEVLAFVEDHGLEGSGLGWIDVHLLASAKLSAYPLWTLDKALDRAARRLASGA